MIRVHDACMLQMVVRTQRFVSRTDPLLVSTFLSIPHLSFDHNIITYQTIRRIHQVCKRSYFNRLIPCRNRVLNDMSISLIDHLSDHQTAVAHRFRVVLAYCHIIKCLDLVTSRPRKCPYHSLLALIKPSLS